MARKDQPKGATPSERPSARRAGDKAKPAPSAKPSRAAQLTPAAAATPAKASQAPARVGARRHQASIAAAPPLPLDAPAVAASTRKSVSPSTPRARRASKPVPQQNVSRDNAVEPAVTMSASVPPPAHPSVQEQLQEIEQRLDALLDDVHESGSDVQARKRAADAIGHIAARLDAEQQMEQFEGTTLLASARELLSTDYYLRQWGRIGMRNRSEQVDDFGLDPTYEARVRPLFELLYERYFRVETEGLEHIPASGRVLLIGNHSGTIPLDGVMLKTAIWRHHSARREMRWLAEDFVFHFPFLGAFMNRIGAVRACQENAQRLLAQENLLAVFPEGIQGIGKLYRDRYRLQRFGRGGYIKLALRTGAPIVPVAIVGAEETYPLLLKLTKLAKPMGVPFVPVTPLFPLLGPVGLLPLPSRWRIRVGAPITELSEYSAKDAEDPIVVNRLNERVRHAIQGLLETALRERGEHAFVAAS